MTGPGDTAVANPERGPIPQSPSPGNGNVLAQSPAQSPSTQPPSQPTAQPPSSQSQLAQGPQDPPEINWEDWVIDDNRNNSPP
jgi:hypothetical protein